MTRRIDIVAAMPRAELRAEVKAGCPIARHWRTMLVWRFARQCFNARIDADAARKRRRIDPGTWRYMSREHDAFTRSAARRMQALAEAACKSFAAKKGA